MRYPTSPPPMPKAAAAVALAGMHDRSAGLEEILVAAELERLSQLKTENDGDPKEEREDKEEKPYLKVEGNGNRQHHNTNKSRQQGYNKYKKQKRRQESSEDSEEEEDSENEETHKDRNPDEPDEDGEKDEHLVDEIFARETVLGIKYSPSVVQKEWNLLMLRDPSHKAT